MRALVTGDLGFCGRHMVPALEQRGYDVFGVDVKRGPDQDVRSWLRTADTRFDLVVHLAAVVGGRVTIEGSPLDVAVDLSIDAEMFGWAVRTAQPRVVYFSSSAAYPVGLQDGPARVALREDHIDLTDIRSPDAVYGWSKLSGEILAQHAQDAGVRVHVFRPFSGYGTDQDLDYPFPTFAARASRRDDPFDVWGDGQQVRDFIHIDDVVGATLAAVAADVPGPVNLGTGVPTSMDQLADQFMVAAGYVAGFKHLRGEPVGVQYRVADITKMLTFYHPRVTLDEGIRWAL